MKRITGKLTIGLLLILALLPFTFIVLGYHDAYQIIGKKLEYKPRLATRIYDVRGEVVAELFDENRRYVPLKKIPPHVRGAFVAAEDKSFYSHQGFDVFSILRALVIDVVRGEIRQGGSTITQQLAKQLYTGSRRTVKRKVVELFIARELEKRYSKEEILERYLNHIYFGHGVYGIAAASQFYFKMKPEQLGYGESALLASLPSAPARYSPMKHPAAAMDRSRQIITAMAGEGLLSREEAGMYYVAFWKRYHGDMMLRAPSASVHGELSDKAPYFTDYIRKILIANYGEERVYTGGLEVYTTLDLRMQKEARSAVREAVRKQRIIAERHNRYLLRRLDRYMVQSRLPKKMRKKYGDKLLTSFYGKLQGDMLDSLTLAAGFFGSPGMTDIFDSINKALSSIHRDTQVQGSLVAVDPMSGGIRAMIGGYEYEPNDQLNRAYQARRQPGSSFKVYVYGAGVEEKKITPATAFMDLPVIFKERKKTWAPSNYEKKFRGRVLARRALAASLNITSVKAYEMLGGKRIVSFASKMTGVPEKRFEVDPTLALGTSELTPLEMAAGMAVYAGNGMGRKPYGIIRIKSPGGKIIYSIGNRQKAKRIISKEVAFLMTSMLRGVVDHGTAVGAVRSRAGFKGVAAGKTGTNTRYRDAWFAGYTPDCAAVVWFGCNNPKFSLGKGQGGSQVAAPVWGTFMKKTAGFRRGTKHFPQKPPGIIALSVCKKTGLRPVSSCPRKREYFIKGTAPKETCDGDHSEMMSVFDLAKKRKGSLLDKERKKLKNTRKEKPRKKKTSGDYEVEEFKFQ